MTSQDHHCVKYARECIRLAHAAPDPQIREQLLQMAREWMAMAMQEEAWPAPAPQGGAA